MFIMTQATMYSLRGIGFLIGNGSMIPRVVSVCCAAFVGIPRDAHPHRQPDLGRRVGQSRPRSSAASACSARSDLRQRWQAITSSILTIRFMAKPDDR
jgi:hypothetical protein